MIKVKCPTCKKELIWSRENQYRPFCSERCKIIDLGDWASESHRIAGHSLGENQYLAEFDEEFFQSENSKDEGER